MGETAYPNWALAPMSDRWNGAILVAAVLGGRGKASQVLPRLPVQRGAAVASRRGKGMQPVVRWAKAHSTLAGVVLIITSVVFACTLAEAITRIVITVRGHYPQKDPILH